MGNSAPRRLPPAAGKVILSDGGVFTYDEPITAAELMLEHPREVVVEFRPGKKPTPLPADHELEMKKVYAMLPIRKGKPISLAPEEARKILENTSAVLKSKALLSYTGVLPLFVRICPAVGGQHDVVSQDPRRRLADRKEEDRSDFFTDILEGRPEFLSRQVSGKGWKPSLDPITEKGKNRRWVLNN